MSFVGCVLLRGESGDVDRGDSGVTIHVDIAVQ